MDTGNPNSRSLCLHSKYFDRWNMSLTPPARSCIMAVCTSTSLLIYKFRVRRIPNSFPKVTIKLKTAASQEHILRATCILCILYTWLNFQCTNFFCSNHSTLKQDLFMQPWLFWNLPPYSALCVVLLVSCSNKAYLIWPELTRYITKKETTCCEFTLNAWLGWRWFSS